MDATLPFRWRRCKIEAQISPTTTVVCTSVARGVDSRPHLASVLQEGRKSTNIHAGSGVIWGIAVKLPLTPYVRDAFWGGDERTPILRSQRAISLALVDDGEAAAHRRRHRKGNVLDAERLKDASCGFSAR